MKIRKLTLYNIGPYIDENIFDFTISKKKNIVLIGGKNGAGKTTFFNAIKTCLYGCKVWGYDAPGKEYFNTIKNLINSKKLYDSQSRAYIELELVLDDGKQIDIYKIHREWEKNKQSLSENLRTYKNEELLLGSEEDDFINFLLSIIPPDMFNFYFFDGESIADFFLGPDGNKNFRNAFLKLYGLDTLSIMIENFNRNIRKNTKSDSYQNFLNAKKHLYDEELKLEELKQHFQHLNEELDLLQIKLLNLQSEYSKQGGIGLTEWKDLNSQLIQEETKRDSINKWIKDVANNYLPFLIIERQLKNLLKQLDEYQDSKKQTIYKELLTDSNLNIELQTYLDANNIKNVDSTSIIDFINKYVFKEQASQVDFDFTSQQIQHITSQIYEKLSFDKKVLKKALSSLNSSLKNSKIIRNKLSTSSIEDYESFMENKEALESSISKLEESIAQHQYILESQVNNVSVAQNNYNKEKESYSLTLKSKSINDLSERAAATYTLLEEQLIKRQSVILQESFLNCFKAIINKDNFIDGIVIDKNINIIPYKFTTIKRNQLDNYKVANREFLNLLDDPKITMLINDLEFEKIELANLPTPIKSPFSQGEKQVYIMSLYLALLKTSKKNIPFFIDTPFARIDSGHREKIIKNFFIGIKNQLFILSTDEEIVGEYKKMLDPHITNTYTLQISSYGCSTIIPNVYFGEKQ